MNNYRIVFSNDESYLVKGETAESVQTHLRARFTVEQLNGSRLLVQKTYGDPNSEWLPIEATHRHPVIADQNLAIDALMTRCDELEEECRTLESEYRAMEADRNNMRKERDDALTALEAIHMKVAADAEHPPIADLPNIPAL